MNNITLIRINSNIYRKSSMNFTNAIQKHQNRNRNRNRNREKDYQKLN